MRMRLCLAGLLTLAALLLCLALFPTGEAEIDLEPRNMSHDPEDAAVGEVIEGEVEIYNNGDEPAFNVTVRIWVDEKINENIIHDEVLDLVEWGWKSYSLVEFEWTPKEDGDHTFLTAVDWDDTHAESNEDNNNLTYDFTVYSQPKPDLEFNDNASIIPNPMDPAVNDAVDLLVLFRNNGRDNANIFHITFNDRINDVTTEIITIEVRNLQAGAGGQVNITWQPSQSGTHYVTVILDSQTELEEYNESNNEQELEIYVHPHTPELTLDLNRGITFIPADPWLSEPFQNHEIIINAVILNEDPEVVASDVLVKFYDQPLNGSRAFIGEVTLTHIDNGTRFDGQIFPGEATARLNWTSDNGTVIVGNHTIFIEIDPLDSIAEWIEDDNNFSANVTLREPLPDLEVYDIRTAPGLTIGIPGTIEVTLRNRGAQAAMRVPVELKVQWEPVTEWTVNLSEGEFTNVSFDYLWEIADSTIIVQIDPYYDFEELDEANNIDSVSVMVASPRIDVGITNVTHAPKVFIGQSLLIDVEVTNHLAGLKHFKFILYINNATDSEHEFKTPIAFNETRWFQLKWNATMVVGLRNLSIEIVPLGFSSSDRNLSDNRFDTNFTVVTVEYELILEQLDLPEEIYLNQSLIIKVRVHNAGPEILTGGTMVVLYIPDGDHQEQQRTGLLDRRTGEEILTFEWTPQEPGNYTIIVKVDPYNEIEEPDEFNNQMQGWTNVTTEEQPVPVKIVPVAEDSFLKSPYFWLPLLIVMALVIGTVVVWRLRREVDYLPLPPEQTRAADPSAWAPPAVSGATSQVCLQCLSVVAAGQEIRCDCGRPYHQACAAQAGTCQKCGLIFEL